jgi:very-short-patch-repair endonuclease
MGFTGHKHSEETKKKLAELSRGTKHTEEAKKKMSEKCVERNAKHRDKYLANLARIAQNRREGNYVVSEETRQKLSEAGKKRYQDSAERAKCSRKPTQEQVEQMRIERSNRWKNPEFREKQIKSRKGKKMSEETKRKIAEKAKERWENPDFRDKMKPVVKENGSKSTGPGQLNPMYGRNHTEETKNKISKLAKERIKKRPELIENLSKAFKEKMKDPEFKHKMMEHLNNIQSPTSIELAVAKVFDNMGINYESQKIIGPCIADFYLPDINLVVECDGDYWHNLPKTIKKDKWRDNWLRKNGYEIVRIPEHEIKQDVYLSVKKALKL